MISNRLKSIKKENKSKFKEDKNSKYTLKKNIKKRRASNLTEALGNEGSLQDENVIYVSESNEDTDFGDDAFNSNSIIDMKYETTDVIQVVNSKEDNKVFNMVEDEVRETELKKSDEKELNIISKEDDINEEDEEEMTGKENKQKKDKIKKVIEKVSFSEKKRDIMKVNEDYEMKEGQENEMGVGQTTENLQDLEITENNKSNQERKHVFLNSEENDVDGLEEDEKDNFLPISEIDNAFDVVKENEENQASKINNEMEETKVFKQIKIKITKTKSQIIKKEDESQLHLEQSSLSLSKITLDSMSTIEHIENEIDEELNKIDYQTLKMIGKSIRMKEALTPEIENLKVKLTSRYVNAEDDITTPETILKALNARMAIILSLMGVSKEQEEVELEDLPLDIKETVPLVPSEIFDPSVPVFDCHGSELPGKMRLQGPLTFLDMPQPPDITDDFKEPDIIDPDFERNCHIPPLSALFKENILETQINSRNPLTLEQCLGQEKDLPVLNLCRGMGLSICYACCHCGVIFDVDKNVQVLLQGHSDAISCLTSSYDKKFVFIADKGPNSRLNIWKVKKEKTMTAPIKTISYFQTHGVAAVAVPSTGTFLAVISADSVQQLSIWNWADSGETPLFEIKIDQKLGYQNYLTFSSEGNSRLISNSKIAVIFYFCNDLQIASYSPTFGQIDIAKQVGDITSTIFLRNKSAALSATNLGKFILWEKYRPLNFESIKPYHRMEKLVRMQLKSITVLTTINKYIVTGDVAGQIKFYDESLKLVNWIQDVKLGAITTISFDYDLDYNVETPEESLKLDSILSKNAFFTPNFVFGTSMAKIVYVSANGTKHTVIQDNYGCPIDTIDVHPSKPLIALGGQNGLLRMINYKTRDSVASKIFDEGKVAISSLKFNHEGSMVAVGFANGKIEILHGLNLQSLYKAPLADTNNSITHIEFSQNMQFLATADSANAVTMYLIHTKTVWLDDDQNFQFIGRYKAHNQQIRSIMFKYKHNDQSYRFFSISLDRYLVEYEYDSLKSGLGVKSRDLIEQNAMPMYMASYPELSRENLILTCNSHFKFKLINTTTKVCRNIFLGPLFGSPVKKFIISSNKSVRNESTPFIACMIGNKIAISFLPFTGNHHRSFCMVSHAIGVQDLVVSSDGKYIFSVGGAFASLMIWSVNLAALERQERLGGKDMLPFYEQINGGKNGAFMYQLENLFCYAQLRNQGIDTQEKRKVGEKVTISEIPSIMRALGFFPTEQEAYQMINEVKYKNYTETGELTTEIDVAEFLKLYINHRPVLCTLEADIEWAFSVLGKKKNGVFKMNREILVEKLLSKGESLKEEELVECLAVLSGFSRESNESRTEASGDMDLEKILPSYIGSREFLDLLKFQNDFS